MKETCNYTCNSCTDFLYQSLLDGIRDLKCKEWYDVSIFAIDNSKIGMHYIRDLSTPCPLPYVLP